jgi:hypothetical protein
MLPKSRIVAGLILAVLLQQLGMAAASIPL